MNKPMNVVTNKWFSIQTNGVWDKIFKQIAGVICDRSLHFSRYHNLNLNDTLSFKMKNIFKLLPGGYVSLKSRWRWSRMAIEDDDEWWRSRMTMNDGDGKWRWRMAMGENLRWPDHDGWKPAMAGSRWMKTCDGRITMDENLWWQHKEKIKF